MLHGPVCCHHCFNISDVAGVSDNLSYVVVPPSAADVAGFPAAYYVFLTSYVPVADADVLFC
jgi:hypothetical protein